MAVYENGIETKRKMILTTYRFLQNQEASTIKVKQIAEINHCSVAALYRHFETLEYLIIVSSIGFLEPYIREYGKIMEEETNLIKQYIIGWKLFNQYAFKRPDIFYRLYWGQYKSSFSEAVVEYMQLFPIEEPKTNAAYFYSILFSDDIIERDILLLRRMMTRGIITESEFKYYAQSNQLMVKGLLIDAMTENESQRKETENLCNSIMDYNLRDMIARMDQAN